MNSYDDVINYENSYDDVMNNTQADVAVEHATDNHVYEELDNKASDVYVEANCVKVHRIANNSKIWFEDDQESKPEYIDLQPKKS